jgi:arylsulfatase A-like enzyme
MSLFTSVYPSVHRVYNAGQDHKAPRLSTGIATLAEALAAGGYRTAGFHGGGNVSSGYGFDRGFSVYERTGTVAPAVAWVEGNAEGPFFLFFHTYRTHDPSLPDPGYDLFGGDYDGPVVATEAALEAATAGEGTFAARRDAFWAAPREGNEDDLGRIVSLYDGVIRQADDEVGGLIAAIAERAPRTVFVVLSDHGEEFHEHGRFLHDQLYQELLHVPLIVRLPDGRGAGRRVGGRVSLVDVAPTLLELLGLPPLPQVQGVSLLPMLDGAPGSGPSVRDQVFSEKVVGHPVGNPRSNASLIVDGMKLILVGPSKSELYDLRTDPAERTDLASGEVPAELRRRLRAQLAANRKLHDSLTAGRREGASELSDEEIKQLEALGYL